MRSGDDIDARICPLCGESNQCAMAGCGKPSGEPCWCKSETFPKKLLNQLPEGERNRVCICKCCQQNHTAA